MIWYDTVWYDMIWYDMIQYNKIWYDNRNIPWQLVRWYLPAPFLVYKPIRDPMHSLLVSRKDGWKSGKWWLLSKEESGLFSLPNNDYQDSYCDYHLIIIRNWYRLLWLYYDYHIIVWFTKRNQYDTLIWIIISNGIDLV